MRDFAQSRDMKVLDGLEEFRYMRSDQIAEMYFTTIKSREQRLKKVSERMKKLYTNGFVKRFRIGCAPYIYTIKGTRESDKIRHYITIVDVLIELLKLRTSGSVLRWETEKKFDDVICDLYLEYRNEFRKTSKQFFIEVELNSSGDVMRKIEKYSRLFRSRRREGIENDYLYILCSKLPAVAKIEGKEFNFPVKALPLSNFETAWQW